MSSEDDLKSSFSQLDIGENLSLAAWGLPPSVVKAYRDQGVEQMFPWQAECLATEGVWDQSRDLVLAAPTSGGKSLVAELLAAKTTLRRGKKTIIVLPFKALVMEKTNYLKTVFSRTAIKVVSFTGSSSTCPFSVADIAVCVTEKANSLLNRLISENSFMDLGLVVADELHTLADRSRGYILEMLLTKLKHLKLHRCANVQILGMSATLGNLNEMADWLGATCFTTDFRPVTLEQCVLASGAIWTHNFDKVGEYEKTFNIKDDTENVIDLTIKQVLDGHSLLIFCMTKAHCEALAVRIAKETIKVGRGQFGAEMSLKIQAQITEAAAMEMRSQIDACAPGSELRSCVCFGVGFHHAGLADDERAVVEDGFRSGRLRILVATSTLCSGVNLPASVVVVRMGPYLNRQMYLQMVGRAGRTGVATTGRTFLAVPHNLLVAAKKLTSEQLGRVEPSLGGNLMRAVLEAISTGLALKKEEIKSFVQSTFFGYCNNSALEEKLLEILEDLVQNDYIREREESTEATRLGTACVAAGARPEDAKMLYEELHRAQKNFSLDTELHLCYLTTPLYSGDWGSFDWLHWMSAFNTLPADYKRVAGLVGVKENFIGIMLAKSSTFINQESMLTMERHQRFYKALAMMDLIKEKPLAEVAAKYSTSKGTMQSLQMSAAMQAGRVRAFCQQLGWPLMEVLMKSLQQRLQFGVLPELCDLMRVELLTGQQARALYQAGIESVADLARSNVEAVERILTNMPKFGSKEQETMVQKGVLIEGMGTLPVREAATMIVQAAREVVQEELGLHKVNWEQSQPQTPTPQTPPPQKEQLEKAIAALEASCNTPVRTPVAGELERQDLSPDPFEESMDEVEESNDKVAVLEVNDTLEPYFVSVVQQATVFSLSIVLDRDNQLHSVILACEVANETLIFCLDPKSQNALLSEIFAAGHVQIYINNALRKLQNLLDHFNSLECRVLDPIIAAWMLDPDKPTFTLPHLVEHFFPEWKELVSSMCRQNSSPQTRCNAAKEALVTLKVGIQLTAWIESLGLKELLFEVDSEVIKILAESERRGMLLNQDEGLLLENRLIDESKKLKTQAALLAGTNFDPNKPNDVKKVIFNKLKLGGPNVKQSSSKEMLESLSDKHPLPRIIIEYRKLHHIITVTLKMMLQNTSSILHPAYNMLIATGRIHMHEPNVQSVPRDFDLSDGSTFSMRSMFCARLGNVLVSADYRQVELRIMAHLSGDERLIQLLNSGTDIFYELAGRINKTDQVTDAMRQQAKQICYGLLYGMSVDKLKEELKAPTERVHELYESIQEQLSALFDFRDACAEACRSSGKVSTVFGRVRRLRVARNSANSIVQGSAADVAKQAMVRVRRALAAAGLKAHLFLHLHDELIYETSECYAPQVVRILRAEMQAAGHGLKVALPVKVKVGPDWGHLVECHY